MPSFQNDSVLKKVRTTSPLIHCITNPISINQCANLILALGARPMMAEHPAEVSQITAGAGAVLLNLGNITDARMKSMLVSSKTASKRGIPVVIDIVGVACSKLRYRYFTKLIKHSKTAIIKGNYSEVMALFDSKRRVDGVDADSAINLEEVISASQLVAQKYKTIVVASGKDDVVTDGVKTIVVKNGTEEMSKITGTGCLLGAMCASLLACTGAFEAAILACGTLGICGELANKDSGTMSFGLDLINKLSVIDDMVLETNLKTEVICCEKL